MSTQAVPDIIPEIKKWLEANSDKIASFWLYADWRMWARFDLFAHLEKDMCSKKRESYPYWDYSGSHSVPMWGDDEPEVDITVRGAAEQKMKEVAIWICTARPNENDTSFPDFVEKFQKEWKLVHDLTEKNGGGDLEGGKLLFLGIGEKAYEEEDFDFGGLKPEYFSIGGGLYAYYLWYDLPEAKE